jgi:DNA-binding PadR family transcriptional regulator
VSRGGAPTAGPRRSTLALAVLALLAEAPMHPYRMQQLIRQRGKDTVVNVGQRTSLHKAIERLMAAGLVAIRELVRDQNYPERTVYELTPAGGEVLRRWMRDALAAPAREYPEFPAILSFLPLLPPEEVRRQLAERVERLRSDIGELEAQLETTPVPRLFLVEDEYRVAVRRTELEWVERVITDLESGELRWTPALPKEPDGVGHE